MEMTTYHIDRGECRSFEVIVGQSGLTEKMIVRFLERFPIDFSMRGKEGMCINYAAHPVRVAITDRELAIYPPENYEIDNLMSREASFTSLNSLKFVRFCVTTEGMRSQAFIKFEVNPAELGLPEWPCENGVLTVTIYQYPHQLQP